MEDMATETLTKLSQKLIYQLIQFEFKCGQVLREDIMAFIVISNIICFR